MSNTSSPQYIEATSVACIQSNKVLLVKRAHSPSKGLWSFPGGKVLAGEKLEEAAQRELNEETSLSASDLKSWRVSYLLPKTVKYNTAFTSSPARKLRAMQKLVLMRQSWVGTLGKKRNTFRWH